MMHLVLCVVLGCYERTSYDTELLSFYLLVIVIDRLVSTLCHSYLVKVLFPFCLLV